MVKCSDDGYGYKKHSDKLESPLGPLLHSKTNTRLRIIWSADAVEYYPNGRWLCLSTAGALQLSATTTSERNAPSNSLPYTIPRPAIPRRLSLSPKPADSSSRNDERTNSAELHATAEYAQVFSNAAAWPAS